MSSVVRLLSISYSVESDSNTMEPLQLTDTTPPRSPKSEKSWNYVCTPVPGRSPSSPASSTINSTISYHEAYVSINCFIYSEEKGKLVKTLITAEMKSDTPLEMAISRVVAYWNSSKRLNKNHGRVYRAANIKYQDYQELHSTSDAATPLSAYNSHFFVFDTTGHIAQKTPINMESYPIWFV